MALSMILMLVPYFVYFKGFYKYDTYSYGFGVLSNGTIKAYPVGSFLTYTAIENIIHAIVFGAIYKMTAPGN